MASLNIAGTAAGKPRSCFRIGSASSTICWTTARSPAATEHPPGCVRIRASCRATTTAASNPYRTACITCDTAWRPVHNVGRGNGADVAELVNGSDANAVENSILEAANAKAVLSRWKQARTKKLLVETGKGTVGRRRGAGVRAEHCGGHVGWAERSVGEDLAIGATLAEDLDAKEA
jgi:hypothetical protein